MPPADLREEVATVLRELNLPGGDLEPNATEASWRRHVVAGTSPHAKRYLPSRVRAHEGLLDTFMGDRTGVATDGLAVVATAGPPAVGKSTRLDDLGFGTDWRRIDADDFKRRLIEHDLAAGDLQVPPDVAHLTLADGRPVMPLELAGLYHHESTALADKARQRSLDLHENLIVEGTLSYDGQVSALRDDLVSHGYRHLRVVLVDVPLDQALAQALDRWWRGREAGGLGGRFTSPDLIRDMYRPDGTTECEVNAQALVDEVNAVHISAVLDATTT